MKTHFVPQEIDDEVLENYKEIRASRDELDELMGECQMMLEFLDDQQSFDLAIANFEWITADLSAKPLKREAAAILKAMQAISDRLTKLQTLYMQTELDDWVAAIKKHRAKKKPR